LFIDKLFELCYKVVDSRFGGNMENFREQVNHVPALKPGSIVQAHFTSDYVPGCAPIKNSQHFLVRAVKESVFSTPNYPHPKIYDLVLCSKSGKPKKTDHPYTAWAVDSSIKSQDGKWTLVHSVI
jgi:hypothetical protein